MSGAGGNGVVSVATQRDGTRASTGRPVEVGMAVGAGTGPELARVFRSATATLADVHGGAVKLVTCPRRFLSYGALASADLSASEAHRSADEDAAAYVDWLRAAWGSGVRAVFRTAFNAQSLYVVREALRGVQVHAFTHSRGDLLLIRDATQGFYSGTNCTPLESQDRIERVLEFSRDRTHRVLDFARTEAAARWGGPGGGYRLVMAYKFHLLDRRFAAWVREYAASHEVDIELYQPDTTNRQLSRGLLDGRVVLVGANEWADVMHTELLSRCGLGHQEERSARNVYLADDLAGLEEYQTVHGSADDIAGQARVNPFATLRASAALLERQAGFSDAETRMEAALRRVRASRVVTRDLGGDATTEEVAAAVLEAYPEGRGAWPGHRAPRTTRRDALVVVDVLNDFCSPQGRFVRDGLIDGPTAGAVVDRIQRLIDRARAAGTEVIFVRMQVDPATAPATVMDRNRHVGLNGYLAPGGSGSDFFRVSPRTDERVITKAGYDPFLAPEFEAHLRGAGIEMLTLVGAFTDVCVDATARTAYQKGFHVRVLEDCTMALERHSAEVLAFMRRFYGVEVINSRRVYETDVVSKPVPDGRLGARSVGHTAPSRPNRP